MRGLVRGNADGTLSNLERANPKQTQQIVSKPWPFLAHTLVLESCPHEIHRNPDVPAQTLTLNPEA